MCGWKRSRGFGMFAFDEAGVMGRCGVACGSVAHVGNRGNRAGGGGQRYSEVVVVGRKEMMAAWFEPWLPDLATCGPSSGKYLDENKYVLQAVGITRRITKKTKKK